MPDLAQLVADHIEEPRLFLDKEAGELLDETNKVVAVAEERDGKTVYVDAGIHAEGGRICIKTETKAKKVCVEWNNQKVCASWDIINIDVCVEWSTT